MKRDEEIEQLLRRTSLGEAEAVEAMKIGVAALHVRLLDDLVQMWRSGAPDNWPAFSALFDRFEAAWPRR